MTISTAPATTPAPEQARATYSISDVAQRGGFSVRHAHRLNDLNQIPGRVRGLGRLLRFSKAAVDAWLAGERKGA